MRLSIAVVYWTHILPQRLWSCYCLLEIATWVIHRHDRVLPVKLIQRLNVAKQHSVILCRHIACDCVSNLCNVLHVTLIHITAIITANTQVYTGYQQYEISFQDQRTKSNVSKSESRLDFIVMHIPTTLQQFLIGM